ncbi:hypothetical protein [Pseudomonas paraglycinae]|jgi:hypothetical protein|uniref:hypothetical protein n=1 Tax=Pseudomonas paraglycinae TaxID=2892330 RepID=UPI001F3075EA|nr:hypothetical protein [Pseudomonas paraglycinae]
MKIILSPQRREDSLVLRKLGDQLTVNGEVFDFSRLGDGDTLPEGAIQSEWFVGDVTREQGELTLRLLLPIPAYYSPAQAYPEDLVEVPDGEVALPQPLSQPEAGE